MTKSVLAGPPLRRGLAWGLVVLIGAILLLGPRDGSGVAAKDEPAPKTDLPADLALVPPEAFGFISIRVAEIWNHEGTKEARTRLAKDEPDVFQQLEKGLGVSPADVERLTFVMPRAPGPNDNGPAVAILVTTTKPYDRKKLLDELVPESKEKKHKDRTLHVLEGAAVYLVNGTTFLMGATATVEDVLENAGKSTDHPLAPALALAAGKHHVAGGMRPAALLASVGPIPMEVEPFKPLLEATAAYGTIDFGKEVKLSARLVCAGEAEAKDAVTAGKGLVALSKLGLPQVEKELDKLPKGKADTFKKVFKEVAAALKTLPIEAKGNDVMVDVTLKADVAMLSMGALEGLRVAGRAASQVSSANNLKQMALAMHNYHSTYNAFPPAAIGDKDGKPLLSWRVAILPFVEQDNLYKQFRLDEPWDSEHNKKLIAQMPPLYATPEPDGKEPKTKPTTTHYRVFHGPGAAFEGTKGTTIASFTDGTSLTILIVEATDAVTWTKPEELPFDPKKDLPKLGLKDAEKFNVAIADGSVRSLKKTIDKVTLKALITRNGGETVTIPED